MEKSIKIKEKRRGREAGMTLVEIAIVLGVVGALALLGYPTFRGWREKAELRDAAGEVANAMVSARSRAIIERRNYTVRISHADDTYTVTAAGGSTEGHIGEAWRTVDLYLDDSDPDCPSLSGGAVDFLPNNSADAAGFEAVYLRSTSAQVPVRYRVKVLGATARVGVERWSGGAWSGAY